MDQEVRFDTQAAFLGRPSNDALQRSSRLMILNADANAPCKLTSEQAQEVHADPTVKHLKIKSAELTSQLRRSFGFVKAAPRDHSLMQEKRKVDMALHTAREVWRQKELEKHRKKHFRECDTTAFEAHNSELATNILDNVPKPEPRYGNKERARLVELTCQPVLQLTEKEKHDRRLETIEVRIALCKRQECRKRNTRLAQTTLKDDDEPEIESALESVSISLKRRFPLECSPLQCIFCLGDERKSIHERKFEYTRKSKMMDEAQKHLANQDPNTSVQCPHPICKRNSTKMTSLVDFKSHVDRVHKIKLRE